MLDTKTPVELELKACTIEKRWWLQTLLRGNFAALAQILVAAAVSIAALTYLPR